MPTYNFINTNTNEQYSEFFTSYEDSVKYLEENPKTAKHRPRVPNAPHENPLNYWYVSTFRPMKSDLI